MCFLLLVACVWFGFGFFSFCVVFDQFFFVVLFSLFIRLQGLLACLLASLFVGWLFVGWLVGWCLGRQVSVLRKLFDDVWSVIMSIYH